MPLFPRRHWESFHTAWAGAIANVLNNELLPEGYYAEEHTPLGPRVEIEVTTLENSQTLGEASVATATNQTSPITSESGLFAAARNRLEATYMTAWRSRRLSR